MKTLRIAALLIHTALFASIASTAATLSPDLSGEIHSLAGRVSRQARSIDSSAENVDELGLPGEERARRRLARLERSARALLLEVQARPGDLATVQEGLASLRHAYNKAAGAVGKLDGDPLGIDQDFDRLALAYYALEETVAFAAMEAAAEPFAVWFAPGIGSGSRGIREEPRLRVLRVS